MCYFCESAADVEEHHIVPQRFDGGDKRSNTVDLCHDCHWKLERLYNKDFWKTIGIEDPRATQESHVTCEHYSCTAQATDHYRVVGDPTTGGSAIVYRCDDHPPLGYDDTDSRSRSI